MSDLTPRTLGPYKLVEELGQGGMAKVFRARRDGPGGFAKDVALKQILPQYAKNNQLVHRFMEEARIAGALIHGNVVQVYDFGFIDGQYYIAMEYIDGLSLAAVLDACVESGIPLPSPLVAFIGAEVASGLAYAHTMTDERGQLVGVVHRDVSPQNILLSYAGDVKIGDFGIVKAADSLVQTEAGMRLGKVNYMSPEQAAGEKLDGRTDMFALGVTLWEALTLRPMLPRGNAVETFQVLASGHFPPPSAFQRDVPPELEELVMHALAKDRNERYADCEAMARGLRAFVHTSAPGFGRHDLVEYLEWLDPGGNRPSGVGPPVPPPAPLSAHRGETAARRGKRARVLPWLALASAPIVGVGCGAATFVSLSLFLGGESAEPLDQGRTSPALVAPPAPYNPQVPAQPQVTPPSAIPPYNQGTPAPGAPVLPPTTPQPFPPTMPPQQDAAPPPPPPSQAPTTQPSLPSPFLEEPEPPRHRSKTRSRRHSSSRQRIKIHQEEDTNGEIKPE